MNFDLLLILSSAFITFIYSHRPGGVHQPVTPVTSAVLLLDVLVRERSDPTAAGMSAAFCVSNKC